MSSRPATGASADRAYLIAGARGMLGTALQRVLAEDASGGAAGPEALAPAPFVVAPPEREFDITDPETVARVVGEFADSLPEGVLGVLVNAAAYTNVEAAEDDPARAYAVNERGAELLADAARVYGLRFVHVSTDFVFDGRKQGAYVEDDEVGPLSVYGASKLAGERAVALAYPEALTVRTAWVFGPAGTNFPVKILGLADRMPVLKVVTDEAGSPTYTIDLARAILALERTGTSGTYHLAGSGSCTRYEMALEVLRLAGRDNTVVPVTSDAFPTKARRPANSVLDCSRAAKHGVTMPEWRDALARFLGELGERRA